MDGWCHHEGIGGVVVGIDGVGAGMGRSSGDMGGVGLSGAGSSSGCARGSCVAAGCCESADEASELADGVTDLGASGGMDGGVDSPVEELEELGGPPPMFLVLTRMWLVTSCMLFV